MRSLIFVSLVAGCGAVDAEGDVGCDMPVTAAEVAGSGATDCGSVADGADGTAVWACAVDAFEADTRFFAIWTTHGTDSVLVGAAVYDGETVWRLYQDQLQSEHARIDGWECANPAVGPMPDDPADPDDVSGYDYLGCGELLPNGNHLEVCGTCEGCQPPGLPFEQ